MSDDSTNLSAQEVEAIKIGRKALPHAMRNLAVLANHSNPSQQRQAIELLLKYTLADRNLQLEADGKISRAGGTTINATITRVDAKLIQIMDNLPPQLRSEFADLMERIEVFASEQGEEIYEGVIIEDSITCACGCGIPVKPGNKWIHGHHLKKHVASDKVKEIRRKAGEDMVRKQQLRNANS